MKKNSILILAVFVFLSLLFIAASVPGEGIRDTKGPVLNTKTPGIHPGGALKPDIDFGKIPLYFISNKGQVNEKAAFYARASRYTLWLTKEGLVFDSTVRGKERGKGYGVRGKKKKTKPLSRDVSRLFFLNAQMDPEIVPMDKSELRVNYFKGNDRSKWNGDIPTSKAVLYKSLYKNIDLKVYGIEKQIEYDWVVKPGGNPGDIRFRYKNVKGTRIDKNGNLLVETDSGELMHKRPFSYQESPVEERTVVHVTFKRIGKNTYGFEVGEYDKSRELVIDPVVLVYSTYLGGSGGDEGSGIAVDDAGYVYVTGVTSSLDFPVLGGYSSAPGGSDDIFITKLDPTQSGAASLVYSTYLGGNYSDEANGIAVDGSGNAYLTGVTRSLDFPTVNEYQASGQIFSAFVVKVDTTRSGVAGLVYSTYLGGEGYDFGNGIAVDGNGCAYVTGETRSSDFPILNQFQGYLPTENAFVAKLDPTQSGAASLIYSTYLGGGDWDIGTGIAVDAGGDVYVTGSTASKNFPTLNAYKPDMGDAYCNAFIAKFDMTRSGAASLIYATYLGGSSQDKARAIAVDDSGNAYITGHAWSQDFPTLNPYQAAPVNGFNDAFVTKIDTNLGSAGLIYSTFLSGSHEERGNGIAIDGAGYIYVTGRTSSSDFPVINPYQPNQPVGSFIAKLDPTRPGTAGLVYCFNLGGEYGGTFNGIALDNSGCVYITGYTQSSDFPILNQYQTYQGGSYPDVFVTKLIIPPIGLISPNGGEQWNHGSTQTITWNGRSVSGDLKLTLYKEGVFLGRIADNLDPASGSYAWTVGLHSGGTAPGGTGYTVKIKEKGTTVSDESDVSFSIARITVTSPNGGESWAIGSRRTISWNAVGLSGDVKITLYKDGVLLGRIADNLDPASGSFTWTVGLYSGGTASPSPGYSIKIKEKGTTVSDVSDVAFNLTD